MFVHGWTCDHTTLAPQIAGLSGTNSCVALDLRGHGSSGRPESSAWRIEDLAADVVFVIESLGLAPVVLVGHSMGGPVAYEAAAQARAQVAALALLHPMPLRHTPDSRSLFASVAEGLRSPEMHDLTRQAVIDTAMFTDDSDPDMRSGLRELMLRADADTATRCWEALVKYESRHEPLTGLPAQVVSGERAANEDALVEALLPGAQSVHLSTGSFVQLEEPERVTGLIADLIARSRSAI
ncbi:MAG: alpha/beta hydrolase [Actinomycetota bacterium]